MEWYWWVWKVGNIALLVWVSGSWKTDIKKELIKKGWSSPIIFTTRPQKFQKEYDEIVFIDLAQFFVKVINWDFAYFYFYEWSFYWISKYVDYSKNNCIIVDPIGLAVFKKKFLIDNVKYKSYYIDIPKETQEYRLWILRRESFKSMKEKIKEYSYYPLFEYDIVLDWEATTDELAKSISGNNYILTK